VIWGVVNYFDPFSLVHNEEPIREVPDDFYMTDFITEKSLEMIEQFSPDENPFFLYVAHTAPHWPLHALPEDIEKYKDAYTGGWEKLRKDRYRRMLEMGLIDYDPERPGSELTWGYIGDAWASAANTPWRYWKKESYEGGIHTHFIVH